MNKILVTGGLGIIGAYICRALLATSRQPVIYDLGGDTGLVRDIASECIIEHGNAADLPRLLGVMAQHKPVAIAHLAGQIGPAVEQYPWSALNANLIGTTTVFEAARLSGIQRIVFPSSRQVYGAIAGKHRHPVYEPVPEEHPREPQTFYGKIKRACEDAADHYARLYGLDIIALRFSSCFGPGRSGGHAGGSPMWGMIDAAVANRPLRIEAGADQFDDLCYSGESANGFVSALDSAPRAGAFRAYNVSSGELISLREMIAVLKSIYPAWDAEAGPGLDYRRSGPGNYFRMNIAKARAEIGFSPQFNYRLAAIDYAATLERLGKAIA